MQLNTLKALIAKNLAEIAVLKGIELKGGSYPVWTERIVEDYQNGKINNLEKGFDKLKEEKIYGALDYAVFFQGAKISDEEEAEEAWREALESAKNGGDLTIQGRSGKALNGLGGLEWLKMADKNNVNWDKKTFLDTYKNTPEPHDVDFRCAGLNAPMYLKQPEQKLLK